MQNKTSASRLNRCTSTQ